MAVSNNRLELTIHKKEREEESEAHSILYIVGSTALEATREIITALDIKGASVAALVGTSSFVAYLFHSTYVI